MVEQDMTTQARWRNGSCPPTSADIAMATTAHGTPRRIFLLDLKTTSRFLAYMEKCAVIRRAPWLFYFVCPSLPRSKKTCRAPLEWHFSVVFTLPRR
jgi:hypothetical protein